MSEKSREILFWYNSLNFQIIFKSSPRITYEYMEKNQSDYDNIIVIRLNNFKFEDDLVHTATGDK